MATPKLRFKEFNDNWLKVDIQSLVDEKNIDKPMDGNHGEIHPTSADYVEDGIPFVMATDVIDGKVYLDKSKKIKKSQADGLRKGFSLEGDILLTHKATIGNVAKVPELKTPYIMLTPQVTYYRVLNKDKLNQDFIKSTFEAPVFQNALLALCTGATRLYIGISEQRKLPFSYPSKKEQTKIASFLSAVDEKISQLTQKHALLSQYKQGMMQKLFSQQIRFKADDGSEFGEWEDKILKDLFPKIRNGFVGVATPYYVNYGVKYLQGKNIKNGKIDATGLIFINQEFHQKKTNSILKTNDILMVQSGHVGECAVVTEDYDNANCHALLVLSPKSSKLINSKFVVYYFYSEIGKKKIALIKTGNTIEHILASDIKEVALLFPCLAEQTKIANFLSAIDQKIEVVAQQIEQAKTWKKGLLQQMFV
ncbi:restriction endonuclease subunit S [Acinetobacter sp. LUNF3]|uniref:restriction endonuclease subunit S n=1 Tax=Acinetobacter sp. LUNF3 TaxID=2925837 RepID=UPI001F61FD36|nr:restriction endonuclease subunit S [Acinetobacter sp. LUNF3]UNT43937.1 restriction endonuclease subunit S [Acinetobacter sp. LUNF3]